MWNPFKSKPKAVVKLKHIDWNKVKTVEDLTRIIGATGFQVNIAESHWAEFEGLLKDRE